MSAPFFPAIDKTSPVPMYYQLARALEHAIGSGALAPGTKLDNEIVLAARLRIARGTVRQALKELDDSGLLLRIPGYGTYVASANQQKHPNMPFTEP